MLRLLLDEHISPKVAKGVRRKSSGTVVYAMADWENGSFLGQSDTVCLQAAAARKLTLVTYDRRTIPPLLKSWAEGGLHHAGVIFVDDKTIPPSDIGALVKALSNLADAAQSWNWTDRICFLQR